MADTYNYEIKSRLSSGDSSCFEDYQLANKFLAPEIGDKLQVFKNYNQQYDQPIYNGQFVEIQKLNEVEEFILTNQAWQKKRFILFCIRTLL